MSLSPSAPLPTAKATESTRRLVTSLRGPTFNRRQMVVLTLASLVGFFALWELVTRYLDVPSLILPRFSDVLAAAPQMHAEGVLVPNLLISLQNYVVGVLISLAIAVPLGLVVGGIRSLDRIVSPYVWTLYTLPRIVLMPLILIWFGLGDTARILLIVLSAAPAVLVFVMEGAKNTDMSLVQAARAFGASRRQLIMHVALPNTAPFVATGIRMGVSRGLVGLFIGELFTAADGIGYLMLVSSRRFATPRVYLILLLFVAFSVVMVAATNWLEKKASKWRPE
ncbi:MAG: ABC transporter permease subunit [Acidimicrobiia bacterium]|nr:ABC transporter permease subunit [Acidimicrobiia bacterium]